MRQNVRLSKIGSRAQALTSLADKPSWQSKRPELKPNHRSLISLTSLAGIPGQSDKKILQASATVHTKMASISQGLPERATKSNGDGRSAEIQTARRKCIFLRHASRKPQERRQRSGMPECIKRPNWQWPPCMRRKMQDGIKGFRLILGISTMSYVSFALYSTTSYPSIQDI